MIGRQGCHSVHNTVADTHLMIRAGDRPQQAWDQPFIDLPQAIGRHSVRDCEMTRSSPGAQTQPSMDIKDIARKGLIPIQLPDQ
jgi:hypothetical protein